jgi:hypothetical protein
VKRIALFALTITCASPALAEDPSKPKERVFQPEDGFARPDADDLRHGHIRFGVSGGVWTPSSAFAPKLPGLGTLSVGGTVAGQLGVGLGRYLVLGLDGAFAHIPSSDTPCADCGVNTVLAGASLALHPTQGFGIDPWASYGVGYRHLMLTLDNDSNDLSAFDVARIALGADYYPVGLFGFGPYLELDVGLRDLTGQRTSYVAFHAGLRLMFDPFNAGHSFTPGVTESTTTGALPASAGVF